MFKVGDKVVWKPSHNTHLYSGEFRKENMIFMEITGIEENRITLIIHRTNNGYNAVWLPIKYLEKLDLHSTIKICY